MAFLKGKNWGNFQSYLILGNFNFIMATALMKMMVNYSYCGGERLKGVNVICITYNKYIAISYFIISIHSNELLKIINENIRNHNIR